MPITRLPEETKSLIATAQLHQSFESAVSNTLSLLLLTSTKAVITIHPQALRFSITTNSDTNPSLQELAPLAVISSMELSTGTENVHIRRGEILSHAPTNVLRFRGVTVDVWELFCSLPVRRRVESNRELSEVIAATREIVVRIALTSPGKEVMLRSDVTLYAFAGVVSKDALQTAFGLDVEWLRVERKESGVQIEGFVAKEGMKVGRYQICGREGKIDEKLCEIVRDVWKRIPKEERRRRAAFVLNVRGKVVEDFVSRAVREALGMKEQTQKTIDLPKRKKSISETRQRFADTILKPPPLKRPLSEGRLTVSRKVVKRPASAVEDAYRRMIPSWRNPCLPSRAKATVATSYDKRSACITKERIGKVRIVGQVDCKFIVVADELGLYAVDQHAASERHLYETLLKRCEKEKCARKLANPKMMSIPHELRHLTVKVLAKAEEWGWRFDTEMRVTHVPRLPAVGVVLEPESLVEWYEDCFSGGGGIPNAVRRVVASAACHTAVRFGDKLSKNMCESIVTSLKDCETPFVCAHGRPNVVPIVSFETSM